MTAGATGTGYERVRIFASDECDGSALAVVPDAAGLSDETMLAIAREAGAVETTFVGPPGSPGSSYAVRVFTPTGETPFAGHSALGTAVTLVRLGHLPAGPVVQERGASRLSIEVAGDVGAITPTGGPLSAPPREAGVLARACGLPADAVTGEPLMATGYGPTFNFLPVHRAALPSARPDVAWMAANDLLDVTVVAWDAGSRTADSKTFAPGYGIPEDTGCASVALGLCLWLAEAGLLPRADGTYEFGFRQSDSSGRAGVGTCAVTAAGGAVRTSTVRGRVVPDAAGRFDR